MPGYTITPTGRVPQFPDIPRRGAHVSESCADGGHMNGTVARRLRRKIYAGQDAQKAKERATRFYQLIKHFKKIMLGGKQKEVLKGKQIICIGLRRQYLDLKALYYQRKRMGIQNAC
jgi:hypothetical protein